MRRKFDNDFKRNAVQKVLDGQSGASVAREFEIGENLIYKWKKEYEMKLKTKENGGKDGKFSVH